MTASPVGSCSASQNFRCTLGLPGRLYGGRVLSPAVYILLSPATGKLRVPLGPGLRYEPVQDQRQLLPPGLSSAVCFAGILFLFV